MSLSFPKLFAVAAVLIPLCAGAADVPKRKSGLWDIKTSQDGGPGMAMQICIDAKQDDLAAQPADDRKLRQQCPKMAITRSGGNIVIDSVCRFEQTTATGHTVVSGDLASRYRMESATRFDPPMHGLAKSHTVMTGQWLGPCQPGQKHGSTTLSGLPGGGQFKLDPETMKQLEKMQQQYGR